MDIYEKLTDDEFNRLCACKTEQEWSDACDAVKAARDGQYPDEWFHRMNLSGLMAKIFSRFPSRF